jgi:hypothetical protein
VRDVRSRIAFYAATRTYRAVFEHHGWGALVVPGATRTGSEFGSLTPSRGERYIRRVTMRWATFRRRPYAFPQQRSLYGEA